MTKTISDVLEFLYKSDQKELAEIVITEVYKPKKVELGLPLTRDGYVHTTPSLPIYSKGSEYKNPYEINAANNLDAAKASARDLQAEVGVYQGDADAAAAQRVAAS